MNERIYITAESMLDAIDSATWYNGLAPTVFSWLKLEKHKAWRLIPCPARYGLGPDDPPWAENQLQIIWMMAVVMFGGYGTSPRFGWIEDNEGFHKFILAITETWRASEEYDGPEEYRHHYVEVL